MSPTATEKKQTFAFRAACPNLTLIRVPEDEELLSGGAKRKIKGTSYEFNNHVLLAREGDDVLEDGNDPETGEPVFQDKVAWLRAQAAERVPSMMDWFEEEVPVAPPSSERMGDVVQLLAARDAKGLADLLDEEKATWQREDVISAAMSAFEALDAEEPPAA